MQPRRTAAAKSLMAPRIRASSRQCRSGVRRCTCNHPSTASPWIWYIYTHVCMYACMYVCMHVYTHTHTHTHIPVNGGCGEGNDATGPNSHELRPRSEFGPAPEPSLPNTTPPPPLPCVTVCARTHEHPSTHELAPAA